MMKICMESERLLLFLLVCLSTINLIASQLSASGKLAKINSKLSSTRNINKVPERTYSSGTGPERYDDTINEYLTDRTCYWNEMCKEEFALRFRCRCPLWSFCSSPGRYYNAFCSMSGTGYLWSQPKGPPGGAFFKRRPYKMMRVQKSRK